jgi:diguanylate cyclase (GGDEF)-like protein
METQGNKPKDRTQARTWPGALCARFGLIWRARAGLRFALFIFCATLLAEGVFFLFVLRPSASLSLPALLSAGVVALVLSGAVASMVAWALNHWILEPTAFLRDELLRGVHDPDDPRPRASPFRHTDELGQAIAVAHTLLAQNAVNLRRVKDAAEGQIQRLAYYDALTGLPNRTLFLKTLEEQARAGLELEDTAAGRAHPRLAVIALDVDHFKDINDSMGHEVGDAILRALARRLRMTLPPQALVARIGEDEFAVMMAITGTITSARDVANRVADAIRSTPVTVLGEEFQVRASVGVATFPDDGVRPDQLLKNADIALNKAKEVGRDAVREYSHDFDRAIQYRFQTLRDLRASLEHGELSLHFQPQLSLTTGMVTGTEALIRWWKPDASAEGGRFIPPGDFIPVAENSGLILPIGEWVLRRACEAAVAWRDKHGLALRVAVNVSPAQFMQSDLCEVVERALASSGLEARWLELEVTESLFMEDVEHTIDTLRHLHALGVDLAIDDFGTGYSSLSYLRQFPIDRLKIDRSFIKNALTDTDDAAIARTIVGLGHFLGLEVVAEGVETAEQESFLLNEGCDAVQGFLYARPMPEEDLAKFVKAHRRSKTPLHLVSG